MTGVIHRPCQVRLNIWQGIVLVAASSFLKKMKGLSYTLYSHLGEQRDVDCQPAHNPATDAAAMACCVASGQQAGEGNLRKRQATI